VSATNSKFHLNSAPYEELRMSRHQVFPPGKAWGSLSHLAKAVELTKGDYIPLLFGQTSDSGSEEIDRYHFRAS
jgi:hypothetical protein